MTGSDLNWHTGDTDGSGGAAYGIPLAIGGGVHIAWGGGVEIWREMGTAGGAAVMHITL